MRTAFTLFHSLRLLVFLHGVGNGSRAHFDQLSRLGLVLGDGRLNELGLNMLQLADILAVQHPVLRLDVFLDAIGKEAREFGAYFTKCFSPVCAQAEHVAESRVLKNLHDLERVRHRFLGICRRFGGHHASPASRGWQESIGIKLARFDMGQSAPSRFPEI